MASVIDICNGALRRLGQPPIASLDDPVETARAAKDRYPVIRDALLQAHPWNFAIRRAALAADAAPGGDGRAAFVLPADCLAVLSVGAARWAVEGRRVLADAAPPLSLAYAARVTDPALYPPLFLEALSSRLAADLAEPLTQSGTMGEAKMREHRLILSEARSRDAQESGPVFAPATGWSAARMGAVE